MVARMDSIQEDALSVTEVAPDATAPVEEPVVVEGPRLSRPRLTWINALNVAACLSVVILHCSNSFFFGPGWTYYTDAAFVHATFYWPVPIFLMISGATLMDYRNRMGTKEYARRRWQRVGIPFLFWSCVAILFWYFTRWYYHQNWRVFNLVSIIVNIVRGKACDYYWFFPALFSVYLLIVMLSAIDEPLRKRILTFVAVIGVVYQTFYRTIMPLLGYSSSSDWVMPIAGIMLYPVIGYLLFTTDFTRKQRIAIYVAGVAGWLVHLWSLWVMCARTGHISTIYSSYDNICAFTQAAAVFVAFKYIPWDKLTARFPAVDAVITWLSGCTFGVYLVQYFVAYSLGLIWPAAFTAGIIYIRFGFFAVYPISLGIVALIKKIPYLNRVV